MQMGEMRERDVRQLAEGSETRERERDEGGQKNVQEDARQYSHSLLLAATGNFLFLVMTTFGRDWMVQCTFLLRRAPLNSPPRRSSGVRHAAGGTLIKFHARATYLCISVRAQ